MQKYFSLKLSKSMIMKKSNFLGPNCTKINNLYEQFGYCIVRSNKGIILKSRFIRSKRVNEAFHYVFFYRRLISVQYLTSQVRFSKYNTECHNPQVGILPRRFAVRPGRLTYLSKGTAISIFLNFFSGRSIYRTSISVTAGYITVENSRTPDS